MSQIWQREDFQRAAGETLRPGGLALTRRGLDLCSRLCGLKAGALALDLGCGAGATLNLLHELGYHCLGLDKKAYPAWTSQSPRFAQADIEHQSAARAHLSSRGPRFARADIERLPLPDAVADAILCECVISLLPAPESALAEWRRTLRPGGILLLTDFYLRSIAPRNTEKQTEKHPLAAARPATHSFSGCGGATPASPHPNSCLSGARSLAEWQTLLVEAGFRVCLREDHSADLAALAARLLWYGQTDLPEFFGIKSPSGGCRPSPSGTRYGYGLWIARKEDFRHAPLP